MKCMNKNLLLLGKNNFLSNDVKSKLKENDIDFYFEKERIDFNDLNLSSELFCKKYFFYDNLKFQFILNTIHFHNDRKMNNNSNLLLAEHIQYFSQTHNNAKIIYISSTQASKVSLNKYSIDKLNSEKIYIKSDNFLIIRPSTIIKKDNGMVYGGYRGQTILKISKFIKKYNCFPVPDKGEYQHTYCMINSLSNFIIEVLKKDIFKNQIINFFSGEYLSYLDFLKKISNYLNKDPKFIFIPINIFKLLLSILLMKKAVNQIKNLVNEKIEYDKTNEIKKVIKMEIL